MHKGLYPMLTSILVYLGVGAVVGFLGGLLGIGGGTIIVPLLAFSFAGQGIAGEHIQHMAVATSLACIIATSIASARAHNKRQSVDWSIFKSLAPGLFAGTLGGTWFAAGLNSRTLEAVFVVFLIYVSIQMLLNIKPKPSRQLPSQGPLFGIGGMIGGLASLIGIGGGNMVIPLLTWCNVPLRLAIGTSSAAGLSIALAGSIGYAVNGWHVPNLPPYSLGYIYIPAFVCISASSMLVAGFGAAISHKAPLDKLRKFFALFLTTIALKMIWSFFS